MNGIGMQIMLTWDEFQKTETKPTEILVQVKDRPPCAPNSSSGGDRGKRRNLLSGGTN